MLVNLPREAIEDGVVRNGVITEFFLTNKDDEYQIKSEYLLPDKEVADPTTDCDACGMH